MNKYDKFIKRAETSLYALENLSPDEIAQHFQSIGIKGWRIKPEHCPVSEYVRFVLNTDEKILSGISDTGIYLFNYPRYDTIIVKWNENIKRFVLNFDRGDYPALERRR